MNTGGEIMYVYMYVCMYVYVYTYAQDNFLHAPRSRSSARQSAEGGGQGVIPVRRSCMYVCMRLNTCAGQPSRRRQAWSGSRDSERRGRYRWGDDVCMHICMYVYVYTRRRRASSESRGSERRSAERGAGREYRWGANVCMYVCMYMYIHMPVRAGREYRCSADVCMYVYMYAYVYTYTHAQDNFLD